MNELDLEKVVKAFLNDIRSSGARLPWEEDIENKFLMVNKTLKNNMVITIFVEYSDHKFDIVFFRLNKDSIYFTSDFKDIDPSLSSDGNIETAIAELVTMSSPLGYTSVKNDDEFLYLIDSLYSIMTNDTRNIVGVEDDPITKFNILDFSFPENIDPSIINFTKLLCRMQ